MFFTRVDAVWQQFSTMGSWLPSKDLPDMFLLPCLLTYSQLFNIYRLAVEQGFEQPLVGHVPQLPGRTQLTGVLLQHSACDRAVNSGLIALCDYLYQQQRESQCRWN